MNDELARVLAGALSESIALAVAAGDFIAAELPDVIQQLLLWRATYSFLWFVICMTAALACYFLYRRIAAWIQEPNIPTPADHARCEELMRKGYSNRTFSEDDELNRLRRSRNHFAGVQYCALLPGPFLLLASISYFLELVKILIAPKIYLIEYAALLAGK